MKENSAAVGNPADARPPGTFVVSLARVIDRACLQILNLSAKGERATAIRVSVAAYETIARARAHEVASGYPLLLLDLELIADPNIPLEHPVVLTG
jgi:hypothetical protein